MKLKKIFVFLMLLVAGLILVGCAGDPGEKGPEGDAGAQGEQGEQGDKGSKGDKGDPGDPGDPGAQGNQGAQGDQGDQGDSGDFIVLRENGGKLQWKFSEAADSEWEDLLDMSIIGKYMNKYTVTLDVNGGQYATSDQQTVFSGLDYLSSVVLPIPTKSGAVFEGWYADEVEFTDDTQIEFNVTLKAKWIVSLDIIMNSLGATILVTKNATLESLVLANVTLTKDNGIYSTLSAAVAAANANDSIYVEAGDYAAELITISKAGLKFYGPNFDKGSTDKREAEAVINSTSGEYIAVKADNVSFQGFKFQGAGASTGNCIIFTGNTTNFTISNNVFYKINTVAKLSGGVFSGKLAMNDNYFELLYQFYVFFTGATQFSNLEYEFKNNYTASATGQLNTGSNSCFAIRGANAETKVLIEGNVFEKVDMSGAATTTLIRVDGGQVFVINNEFQNLPVGRFYRLESGCTTVATFSGNTYKGADGNILATAPDLGGGATEVAGPEAAFGISAIDSTATMVVTNALDGIADGAKVLINFASYTVGTNAFSSLTKANAVATSTDIIYLAAGVYSSSQTVSVAGVTVVGPNKGKAGYATDRKEEALFTNVLKVTGADVTINGLAATAKGRFEISNNNITLKCLNVYAQTGAKNTEDMILITKGVKNPTIDSCKLVSISQSRAASTANATDRLVESFTFTNNYAEGLQNTNDSSSKPYVDGIRLQYFQGTLKVIGNTFIGFDQYPIWAGSATGSSIARIEIINNYFAHGANFYASDTSDISAVILLQNSKAATTGVISYNTFEDCRGNRVLNLRGTITNGNYEISYNKFLDTSAKQVYLTSGDTTEPFIVKYNYFAKAPTAANVMYKTNLIKASYNSADAVPTYNESVAKSTPNALEGKAVAAAIDTEAYVLGADESSELVYVNTASGTMVVSYANTTDVYDASVVAAGKWITLKGAVAAYGDDGTASKTNVVVATEMSALADQTAAAPALNPYIVDYSAFKAWVDVNNSAVSVNPTSWFMGSYVKFVNVNFESTDATAAGTDYSYFKSIAETMKVGIYKSDLATSALVNTTDTYSVEGFVVGSNDVFGTTDKVLRISGPVVIKAAN